MDIHIKIVKNIFSFNKENYTYRELVCRLAKSANKLSIKERNPVNQ